MWWLHLLWKKEKRGRRCCGSLSTPFRSTHFDNVVYLISSLISPQIQRMVISGGNFKPDQLKPKEVVSLLLDDDEIERKCEYLSYARSADKKKSINVSTFPSTKNHPLSISFTCQCVVHHASLMYCLVIGHNCILATSGVVKWHICAWFQKFVTEWPHILCKSLGTNEQHLNPKAHKFYIEYLKTLCV